MVRRYFHCQITFLNNVYLNPVSVNRDSGNTFQFVDNTRGLKKLMTEKFNVDSCVCLYIVPFYLDKI